MPGTNDKQAKKLRGGLRKLSPTVSLPVGSGLRQFSAEQMQRLRRRIAEPHECVLDPSFPTRSAERRYAEGLDQVLADTLKPLPNARPKRSDGRELRRALTATEEVELFLRFNYYRYRAMKVLAAHKGKRLTAEAAREYLSWDRMASRVRDEIADANLGLVPTMVERSRITGVDFGDLISEGHLALLRSIDKFDAGRGFKFSTYACRSILTAITRSVALMARYRSRFPTEFDPDMQKSDHAEVVRASVEDDCLDELQGLIRDNSVELSRIELRVLAERFGVSKPENESKDTKTLRQVADLFGVTKERVRQIQNKALEKLRLALTERVLAV